VQKHGGDDSQAQESHRFREAAIKDARILFLVSCSNHKIQGGTQYYGTEDTILKSLPKDERRYLIESRRKSLDHIRGGGFTRNGKRIIELPYNAGLVAGIDFGGQESASLLPAWKRYRGRLYREIPDNTWATRIQGALIFSGLYGLLIPEEPIQLYSLHLRDSSLISNIWASGIALVLLEYASRNNIDIIVDCLGENLYRNVFDWQYLSSEIRVLHAFGAQNAGPAVLTAIGNFLATAGLVSDPETICKILFAQGEFKTPYERLYFLEKPEYVARLGLPEEDDQSSRVDESRQVPVTEKPSEIVDMDRRHGIDITFSYKVLGEWGELPDEVRKKVLRILTQFILNPGDPGAKAEKLTKDGKPIYRLRIDKAYRMHLEKEKNVLVLRAIGAHRLEGIG
jgi:mRNA-degrading endonuclease RelE of RelBE toxin-antitoxin system